MENPAPSNIIGTPILDNYIKELLLENKRTSTLNHEEALKGICLSSFYDFGASWKKRKKLHFKSYVKIMGTVPQC